MGTLGTFSLRALVFFSVKWACRNCISPGATVMGGSGQHPLSVVSDHSALSMILRSWQPHPSC